MCLRQNMASARGAGNTTKHFILLAEFSSVGFGVNIFALTV